MDISQVNRSPLAALMIDGADTLVTVRAKLEAAILLNTATKNVSIPAKLPWLSNAGTAIKILKVASGAIVALSLLVGVTYGSPGIIDTLFANNVGAGYANVLQTPALARSVASVPRKVVIAAGIYQPINVRGLEYGWIKARTRFIS